MLKTAIMRLKPPYVSVTRYPLKSKDFIRSVCEGSASSSRRGDTGFATPGRT